MPDHYHVGLFAGNTLLDPWSHGIGIMRDVCARWSELDITQVGSLIAIAGTLPTAWKFLNHVCRSAWGGIRRFFLVSVRIPGGDPLNNSVVKWIAAHRPRHDRSFIGRTVLGSSQNDRAVALKKKRHPVYYHPHWSMRWFMLDWNAFLVHREGDEAARSYGEMSSDGYAGETLTVSCFGWSVDPIKRFLDACREYAEEKSQFFVIIYSRDPYGVGWKPRTRKPIRRLDTVHFDNSLKEALLSDIRTYLDVKTQWRYLTRSMPYRRGYLFYGPPGTGKSSLSIAIAGEFGLDLYEVKIPSIITDAELEQMFQEIPPRCVVLLEDIDAVWVDRANQDKTSEKSSHKEGARTTNCTLSGLLNVLDGVGSQEGRIVIMTTNYVEQLDDALIRPGRVDMKLRLGNISRHAAEEMFVRMFSPALGAATDVGLEEVQELAVRFAREVPDDMFTPSHLQGFFQMHLDSPHDAVEGIASWVQNEQDRGSDKGSDKDFEVVSSKRQM